MSNRKSRTPMDTTTGDGRLFVPLVIGILCFLLLLGVVAATGEWFGRDTGQSVLEIGLCVVFCLVVGLVCWTGRGGRR